MSRLQQTTEDDETKKGDMNPVPQSRVETLRTENDILSIKLRDFERELKRITDENYDLRKQLPQARQIMQEAEENKIIEVKISLLNEVERWKAVISVLGLPFRV
ncbi:hypothetical protein K469DRAFT_688630 [Zopfia rhizophila CBS 207.26]|uniref:Uncharacterized protein n=1 Tax=Zopfia rhizophila CBS 207.26 TaxID=1314779 RepID=A0A6A6E2B3_9PEZI|nr:hypothetical protein K469DRAFT_688630 [Zopfia rhizophila CBS 207.26]